jgi:hypothetical protein
MSRKQPQHHPARKEVLLHRHRQQMLRKKAIRRVLILRWRNSISNTIHNTIRSRRNNNNNPQTKVTRMDAASPLTCRADLRLRTATHLHHPTVTTGDLLRREALRHKDILHHPVGTREVRTECLRTWQVTLRIPGTHPILDIHPRIWPTAIHPMATLHRIRPWEANTLHRRDIPMIPTDPA